MHASSVSISVRFARRYCSSERVCSCRVPVRLSDFSDFAVCHGDERKCRVVGTSLIGDRVLSAFPCSLCIEPAVNVSAHCSLGSENISVPNVVLYLRSVEDYQSCSHRHKHLTKPSCHCPRDTMGWAFRNTKRFDQTRRR